MSLGFDFLLEDSFGLIDREIVHDRGAGICGGRADRDPARPLRHRQYGSLCRSRPTLAAPPRRRSIGRLLRPAAEMELVDFDRAAERLLPRQRQPRAVTHPPSRRLAHPERLG